jgi:hypothetical protein
VGLTGGWETAVGNNIPSGTETAWYNGLTIPIGLEFGFPTKVGGLGLLFQIADVGQVATWRSQHDSGTTVKTTPPGLTFASVYAPGLSAVWNVPGAPIAIGTGYTYAPEFRDLTVTNDPTRPKANVHRVSIFTAVDVPIFP